MIRITVDKERRTVDLWDTEGIGYSQQDPYWISFDRFNTPMKLLGWLKHLHEKIWWNADLAFELMKIWEQINKKLIQL